MLTIHFVINGITVRLSNPIIKGENAMIINQSSKKVQEVEERPRFRYC